MSEKVGEAGKLGVAGGYDEVFSIVKEHVEEVMGLHRAGLTLGLSSLPPGLGAYHVVGSNMIVLNRTLLERVRRQEPPEIVSSFLYMLLLHEYLHSLGIVDEGHVRKTSEEVAGRMLGNGHPASILIRTPITQVFPYLEALHPSGRTDGDVEIVRDFDSRSYSFIS